MATIIIKNSTGSNSTPASLLQGELAINTVTGKMFYGSGSGNAVKTFPFPYTGSAEISGSLIITGSTISTLGFTGSLLGTSSWADSASNSIQSQTASFLPIGTYNITSSWAQSASQAVSASFAITASFALNAGSTFNSTSSIIGNGVSSSFNINHGFNTRNLHITVYESGSNGETVYPDIRRINENTASIIFANPPTSNQYIVYISQ